MSLSAEDKPPLPQKPVLHPEGFHLPENTRTYDWDEEDEGFSEDDEIIDHSVLDGHTSLKFLLAGGVAGAGQSPSFCRNAAQLTLQQSPEHVLRHSIV